MLLHLTLSQPGAIKANSYSAFEKVFLAKNTNMQEILIKRGDIFGALGRLIVKTAKTTI